MSILLLPTELVAQILSHLPDIPSLSAARHTASYLYYSFRSFRVMILHRLSLHTVGGEALLPEAMAVLRAQRSAFNDRTEIQAVMGAYVSRCGRRSSPRATEGCFWRYDMAEAWTVHRVHRAVCFFADRYLRDASRRACGMQRPTDPDCVMMRPPSAQEVLRVRRAFYRVQLYSDLFRSLDLARQTENHSCSEERSRACQIEDFVRRFSVLALEQMASVCEFLFWDIRDAFEDVANHDCWWALQGVVAVDIWPREHWQSEWLRNFVAEGLPFLQKAVEAQTFDERSAILSPKLGYRCVHLLDWLDWDDESGMMPTDRNETTTTVSADDDEADSGPIETYTLFHHPLPSPTDPPFSTVRRDFTAHRRAGYVFWDAQRIRTDLQQFRGPRWRAVFSGEGSSRQHRQVTPAEWRRLVDARQSMFHRRELYLRGARGWWHAGDESRLEWFGVDYYYRDAGPNDDGEEEEEEEEDDDDDEAYADEMTLELFTVMPILQYEVVRRVDCVVCV